MKSYTDKSIEIEDHRLTDFDIGYVLAPLTLLTINKERVLTIADRHLIRKVYSYANQIPGKLALIVLDDRQCHLPIILQYLIKDPSRVAYYLAAPIKDVPTNLLTQDLASTIKHYSTKNTVDLLEKASSDDRTIIAIVDPERTADLGLLLPELNRGRLLLLLMPSYASKKTKSLYFDVQRLGKQIIEYADGVGEVTNLQALRLE